MAMRMAELATQQKGFLGMESARGENGQGITVSYWDSREAIRLWKANAEHLVAQKMGRQKWYQHFRLRIAEVIEDREK